MGRSKSLLTVFLHLVVVYMWLSVFMCRPMVITIYNSLFNNLY